MPIPPVVGQEFKTANGLKATVTFQGPPDTANGRFFGSVAPAEGFTYTLWRGTGVNLNNPDWALVSLWPTNTPIRYQPMLSTHEGTFKIMAAFYLNLAQLKTDWAPQGCVWAAKVDRDGSGNPTLAVVAV